MTLRKGPLKSINGLDYVFRSCEGQNESITRSMVLRIVKSSYEAVGIKEKIGCHSLRKIFGAPEMGI